MKASQFNAEKTSSFRLTENGYIKRVANAPLPISEARRQRHRAVSSLKEDDALMDVFFAYSHDTSCSII